MTTNRMHRLLLASTVIIIASTSAVRAQEPAPVEPIEAAPPPPALPAPHTHAPVPPKEDDFDLSTLGLDPSAAFDDKLNIYGFVDFGYQYLSFERGPFPDSKGFAVGNLNLYIAKNLTRRWRTLTEVRMLFAPNGSMSLKDGSLTSTTTTDPANLAREIEWGGIRIERAYLEYDVHPNLTIRAGHWLTPYGIWNVDHGSPAIIPTARPYVIGEQFIPEHQTGIHAFGSTYVGEYKVGYHATVSNGRSSVSATQDPDGKLAFGGRLELAAPWAGSVQLGVSAYVGRATQPGATVFAPSVSQDEVSYAADVAWHHDGLLVQGEAMVRNRNYLVGRRLAAGAGFQPDGRDVGAYALVGYRFDRAWNVMPFATVEYYNPLEVELFRTVTAASVGVNFRPISTVVLKAMATIAEPVGSGPLGSLGRLTILGTQAAWVF